MEMLQKQVQDGPFKGTVIPADATRATDNGDSVWWHPRDRTPIVLDRFPIDAGWSITCSREPSELRLAVRDPDTGFQYRDANDMVMLFPTVYITATLTNPEGKVVAQASTLIAIDGPQAYEAGENNARNRLYEAIGLIGAHRIDEFQKGERAPAAASSVVPIKATPAAVQASPGEDPAPPPTAAASPSPMAQVKAVPSSIKRKVPRPDAMPAAPAASSSTVATAPAVVEQPQGLTPALLAIAQQRAAVFGREVPVFADDDAIQAFLDDLAA